MKQGITETRSHWTNTALCFRYERCKVLVPTGHSPLMASWRLCRQAASWVKTAEVLLCGRASWQTPGRRQVKQDRRISSRNPSIFWFGSSGPARTHWVRLKRRCSSAASQIWTSFSSCRPAAPGFWQLGQRCTEGPRTPPPGWRRRHSGRQCDLSHPAVVSHAHTRMYGADLLSW